MLEHLAPAVFVTHRAVPSALDELRDRQGCPPFGIRWASWDSNPEPPGYEPEALTIKLEAQCRLRRGTV